MTPEVQGLTEYEEFVLAEEYPEFLAWLVKATANPKIAAPTRAERRVNERKAKARFRHAVETSGWDTDPKSLDKGPRPYGMCPGCDWCRKPYNRLEFKRDTRLEIKWEH